MIEPTPPPDRRRPLALAWTLLRGTWREYWDDRVPRLAAALAFYTLFAAAPLLVLGIRAAGLIFGPERTRTETARRLHQLLGGPPADAAKDLMDHAAAVHPPGLTAGVVAVGVLLYIAGAWFAELQDALNTIWEVRPGPDRTWAQQVRGRLFPFAMVLVAGVVLVVTLAAGPVLDGLSPGPTDGVWVHRAVRLAVSGGVFAVAFAAVFKVLPDVVIRWRDVAVGAIVTAALFTAGSVTLSWYLRRPGALGVYGTASSAAVLLLWVYYSAQVLFVGAEFTQVYAHHVGRKLEPARGAVHVGRRREAVQAGV